MGVFIADYCTLIYKRYSTIISEVETSRELSQIHCEWAIGWYSPFLTWCARALTHEWIAIFLVQSTKTCMLDSFTRMFVTYTREYEILASLLAGTQVGISNTLRALTTHYEFTCKLFAFIILPAVNILQGWLSLLWNYYIYIVWKEYDFFPWFVHIDSVI